MFQVGKVRKHITYQSRKLSQIFVCTTILLFCWSFIVGLVCCSVFFGRRRKTWGMLKEGRLPEQQSYNTVTVQAKAECSTMHCHFCWLLLLLCLSHLLLLFLANDCSQVQKQNNSRHQTAPHPLVALFFYSHLVSLPLRVWAACHSGTIGECQRPNWSQNALLPYPRSKKTHT